MADGRVDEALERLHATADEYGMGLSNHGPMTVQALAAVGAVDEVLPWVRRYERKLEPADEPAPDPVEGDWQDVLRASLPALVTGSVSAAGHGAIRTAHAVALLEEADTPPRRTELARALRYWRRSYERLDPGPPMDDAPASVQEAWRRLPPLPSPGSGNGRLLSDRLRDLPPLPVLSTATIDDVATAAASVLVASPPSATIALVHAVTTPAAMRVLDPYLPDGVAATQAWVVATALVATFADRRAPLLPLDVTDPGEAVALAVESGDEHAIKLAATGVAPAVVAEVARRLSPRPPPLR